MELKLENLNKLMFDKLETLILDKKLQGKKIILFGLNSTSFAIKKYLEKNGINISAYIDNDLYKLEEMNRIQKYTIKNIVNHTAFELMKEHSIKVMKPEEIAYFNKEEVIILIASKYYQEMKAQLEEIGYQEDVHIHKVIDFYMLDEILGQEKNLKNSQAMTIDEVKSTQLEILKKLKNVCNTHGLRYYICGGTLLGAVRHKGYIPWDDDVDVVMPMPDYKKLIELLNADPKYTTLSAFQQPEIAYFFFMKMIDKDTILRSWEYPFLLTSGVGIDIFPLFGLPEGDEKISQFYKQIRYLNTEFINTYLEDFADDENEKYRLEIQAKIINMMEKYLFDESMMIGYVLSKYKEKEIMPRSIYQSNLEIEFEGIKLSAAEGYQQYLSILFYNYMELPPINQRYNTHNFIAYKNNY